MHIVPPPQRGGGDTIDSIRGGGYYSIKIHDIYICIFFYKLKSMGIHIQKFIR